MGEGAGWDDFLLREHVLRGSVVQSLRQRFCRSGKMKPYVGKLMRLYEEDRVGKVRIWCFFRPEVLPLLVRKDFPSDMLQSKELFIGLGSGIGVENENMVEVIFGKAMVLCMARIKDNLLSPNAHLEYVHHLFNRAYDVGKKKLVRVGNIVNTPLVEKMCNKGEWMLALERAHLEKNTEDGWKAVVASKEENNLSDQGLANSIEVK